MPSFRHESNTNRNTARGDIRIETKRVTYTVTADDVTNKFLAVPVVFDTPFDDENYTASVAIHDNKVDQLLNHLVGDYHNKTKAGLTAVSFMGMDNGAAMAGDVIEIEVTAIHD